MPTYERFEDLPVWQQTAKLYEAVDAFLDQTPRGVNASSPTCRPSIRSERNKPYECP